MPDRIIRDKSRRSETLRGLSDAAERAWWRLTITCDDYGCFEADSEVLLAECFHRKPLGWTIVKMSQVIEEWERVGLIHRYANGGPHVYGHAPTFADYQRPRHSKPKFPLPPCGNLPQNAAKCGESRRSASESRESLTTVYYREPRDEESRAGAALMRGTAVRLLEFLNEKAGRRHRTVPATLEPIMARLREGATEQECRSVIARKVRDWNGDPRMVKYLRPETLFNRTKFESYLGERTAEGAHADVSPVQ